MSFGPFRVKTIIFDQNRVHRVNTGQTMSTRVKNEFQAVSGQNLYFRPKPSPPGQYGSNHVDRDKKMSFRLFWVKTVIFFQNPIHRVDTHRKFFLVSQHNFRSLKLIFNGWIGLFLILIWVFSFTYINIYYYI
jgi:hypothetical protein